MHGQKAIIGDYYRVEMEEINSQFDLLLYNEIQFENIQSGFWNLIWNESFSMARGNYYNNII